MAGEITTAWWGMARGRRGHVCSVCCDMERLAGLDSVLESEELGVYAGITGFFGKMLVISEFWLQVRCKEGSGYQLRCPLTRKGAPRKYYCIE
jgi:hypothetical protein